MKFTFIIVIMFFHQSISCASTSTELYHDINSSSFITDIEDTSYLLEELNNNVKNYIIINKKISYYVNKRELNRDRVASLINKLDNLEKKILASYGKESWDFYLDQKKKKIKQSMIRENNIRKKRDALAKANEILMVDPDTLDELLVEQNSKKIISHRHGGVSHTHPLPAEGVNHSHTRGEGVKHSHNGVSHTHPVSKAGEGHSHGSGQGVKHTHRGVPHTHPLPSAGIHHSHNTSPRISRVDGVVEGVKHTHRGVPHTHPLPREGIHHTHVGS